MAAKKCGIPEDITDSDVEKVICSGIPIKNGKSQKNVRFHSGKTFQSEAFQQSEDQQYPES